MSLVSGLALKILPMFIEEEMGKDGLDKWKDTLSDDLKEVYFDPDYILDKWYDVDKFFLQPTQTVCNLFYDGNKKAAWTLGRYSAEFALNGILKVFIKLGTTMFLINRSASIVSKYYKTMDIKAIKSGKNYAILAISNYPDYHILLEYRLCGWIERALEISGCHEVKIDTIKPFSKEDPTVEIKFQWQ
jgi:hypothetical protein